MYFKDKNYYKKKTPTRTRIKEYLYNNNNKKINRKCIFLYTVREALLQKEIFYFFFVVHYKCIM